MPGGRARASYGGGSRGPRPDPCNCSRATMARSAAWPTRPTAHQVAIWEVETGLTFLLAGLDEVVWGFGVDAERRKLFLGLGKRYLAAWPLKEWWIAGWAARPMGPGPIHQLHHTRIAERRP